MKTLSFHKESNGNWHVLLPEYPGLKSDLLMIGGADTAMDVFSNGDVDVSLQGSESQFGKSDIITFVKDAKEEVGEGGFYILNEFKGEKVNMQIFLCDVMKFIFGKFPEKLYFVISQKDGKEANEFIH